MGLDMYLKASKNNKKEEIGYWRKHPNLHGYIGSLYYERGGNKEFNCVEVQLSKEDIENIIIMSIKNSFPDTTGFFFGKSTEEDNIETIVIMEEALNYIKNGYEIYYDSWW